MDQTQISWQTQQTTGQAPNRTSHTFLFHNNSLIQFQWGTNDIYILNLSDFKWSKIKTSNGPKSKYGVQSVGYKDKGYFFGGSSANEGGLFFDEFFELNLNNFIWKSINYQNRPQGRVDHTLCFYKEQIYIFGGRANKKIFNDLIVLDLNKEKCEQLDQGPCHRFGHQSNIYEDIMIVTGGFDGLNVLQDVWLYLINQKQWIKAECKGIQPESLFKHNCTIAGREHLIIFGGLQRDGKNETDDFYALNLVQFKWIQLPKFQNHPAARIYHTIISLNIESREELLVIGGYKTSNTISIINFNMVQQMYKLQFQFFLRSDSRQG